MGRDFVNQSEHNVNIATVTGGNERLEANRVRQWEVLDERERQRVLESCERVQTNDAEIAPFGAMRGARERVLYAATLAHYPRSAPELRYLLLVCWQCNIDIDTIRARLAQMTVNDLLRPVGDASFAVTELGFDELTNITTRWLAHQQSAIRAEHAERPIKFAEKRRTWRKPLGNRGKNSGRKYNKVGRR